MGKSRLAHEAVAGSDPECRFVDLRGAHTPAEVVETIAEALEFDVPAGDTESVDGLADRLEAFDIELLVLDNADDALETLRQHVGSWLREAPALNVLVTSRERLRLESEFLVELEPLATGRVDATGQALSDAGRLLIWHLDRLGIRDEESDADVESLARRLDGIPLALETIAPLVEMLGIPGVLERLERQPESILGTAGRGRATTLRSAFETSWSRLDSSQRSILGQLGVFRGELTVEAAETVVESDSSDRSTLTIVRELRDRSLLRRLPARDGRAPCFAMHATTRGFALAELSESQRNEAFHRHAAYVTDRVRSAVESVRPLDEAGRAQLSDQREELIAVLDRFDARDTAEARAFFSVAATGLELLDPGQHASKDLLEWVVDDAASPGVVASAARLLARRAAHDGLYDEANELYRRALESVDEDSIEYAVLLADLGRLARRTGLLDEAREHYEEVLELVSDADDETLHARFESERAGLLFEMERTAEAIDGMHRALAMHRDSGNRRSEGVALSNLGQMLHDEGRLDEALSFHEQALALHRASKHGRFEAIAKFDMGVLAHQRGWLQRSRELHIEALRGLEEHGHPRMIALISGSLGAVEARLQIDPTSRFSRARELFRQVDEQVFGVAVDFYETVARLAASVDEITQGTATLEALSSVDDRAGWTDEVRFARRILELFHDQISRIDSALVVSKDHRWFRGPGRDPADLSNKDTIGQVFSRLISARLGGEPHVTRAELVAAGWPDEDILESAATNRLNVSLSQLRKLGLSEVLVLHDGSYTLAPTVPLLLC